MITVTAKLTREIMDGAVEVKATDAPGAAEGPSLILVAQDPLPRAIIALNRAPGSDTIEILGNVLGLEALVLSAPAGPGDHPFAGAAAGLMHSPDENLRLVGAMLARSGVVPPAAAEGIFELIEQHLNLKEAHEMLKGTGLDPAILDPILALSGVKLEAARELHDSDPNAVEDFEGEHYRMRREQAKTNEHWTEREEIPGWEGVLAGATDEFYHNMWDHGRHNTENFDT